MIPRPRAADWSTVRLRVTTIDHMSPDFVTVEFESREIECDDELLHRDNIGFQVLTLATGKQLQLRRSFVPEDLGRPNSAFWIALDNDGNWLLFRDPKHDEPELRVPRYEAV